MRAALLRGDHAGAEADAKTGEAADARSEDWPLLRAEAMAAVGRYADAKAVIAEGLARSPNSIRLRLLGWEVWRQVGDLEGAAQLRQEMDQLGGLRQRMYRTAADRVALGRIALLVGADPKQVLEVFYDPVKKAEPGFREMWLASGELALAKNDFALAGRVFADAVKRFPNDPEMRFGLARAFAPSDPETTREALAKALELNARHTGALLLLADLNIDAEAYAAAEGVLAEALKVNPRLAEAHAYRAVLAELRADEKGAKAARAAALKSWPTNPAVPHLIGRKLAQKYRFAEGAALQREALKFDPLHLPAKAQLAQDLLRLGLDAEGWRLAEEVQKADPYDVVAFNLVELHDAMANFRTLTSEHFTVRMDPREADIYGADVLALLERAHSTLVKKYGVTLRERTVVEIFPDQKDFAIRTFGLPGGAGYLGVCFGRVITANSPASRPNSPANWEAVLWHEFAHVVTLTLTRNRMPRWLSEGISVHEERQARGSWGEKMQPRYRAMMLGKDLVPVSQLSGAFLNPKTPLHLGFAYYESSLVVEWLTQRWGMEKLKRVLADLAAGVEVNAALAAHFAPIGRLDAEFAAHARALAAGTGPRLDWTAPAPGDFASAARVGEFIATHPDNFAALSERAKQLLLEKKWEAAKVPLRRLIELYPEQHDADSSYALLARAHRELGETDEELAMLAKVMTLSSDAQDACARLMELAAARKDWRGVVARAGQFTAINPLSPLPHRAEAEAREALGEKPAAIAAYRALLALDPADPAEIHYRLARLLHATGDADAKRHVLQSLEEAPRFRAALALLLEINAQPSAKSGVGRGTER